MRTFFPAFALLLLTASIAFASTPVGYIAEDKPDTLYVFTADLFTDSYTNITTTDNEGGVDQGQTWFHQDHTWQYGVGGSGLRQFSGQSDDWLAGTHLWGENFSFSWYTTWDTNLLGTEIINLPGYSSTNSVGLPFSVGEFCLVDDPRSPAPTAQSIAADAWITNVVSEKYSRFALTRWHLQTGGKSGRRSLWQLVPTATEVIDKRALPPDVGTNTRAIPSRKITISGLTPDASGYLWFVLPDNTDIDVTPFVAGKDFYTFDVAYQKYAPYIDANGINTATEPAEFCVGQKIVLKPQFDPPLPAGLLQTNQCNWWLPPKYVNAYEQYDPFFANYFTTTCDPVQVFSGLGQGFDSPTGPIYCKAYTNLDWPLHQPETGAWWISGGDKRVTCRSQLVLTNGLILPLTIRGDFNVQRPTFTNFTTVNPAYTNATRTFMWDDDVLSYGDPLTTEHQQYWSATVNTTVPGTMSIVQILNAQYTQNYGFCPDCRDTLDTHGQFWLDGNQENYQQDPYIPSLPGTHAIALNDGPRADLWAASPINIRMWGQFKDYLRFQPSGSNSIPVTLAVTEWSMEGMASPLSGIQTNSTPVPTVLTESDEFPTWLGVQHE